MLSKLKLRGKRELLLGLVLLGMVVLVAAVSFQVGKSSGTRQNSNQSDQVTVEEYNPDNKPEPAQPGRAVFDRYKKQIEENRLEGVEKVTLYINAAFAGSFIKAPEAAEYAKEALNLMPNNMRTAENNKDLVNKLQKIAEGKYDEVNAAR